MSKELYCCDLLNVDANYFLLFAFDHSNLQLRRMTSTLLSPHACHAWMFVQVSHLWIMSILSSHMLIGLNWTHLYFKSSENAELLISIYHVLSS